MCVCVCVCVCESESAHGFSLLNFEYISFCMV